MGPTKRVRIFLRREPAGTVGRIYDGLAGELEVREICAALDRLQQSGELAIEKGGYSYHQADKLPSPIQARIWSVVRGLAQSRPKIDQAEVARLAEADRDYVRRYLGWLCSAGHLQAAGKGAWNATLYRLCSKATSHPHWNRRKEEVNAASD